MPGKVFESGAQAYRAGEAHIVVRNRRNMHPRTPVIATPGRNAGATQPCSGMYFAHVVNALVNAGHLVLSIQGGSLTGWGSDDTRDAVAAGKAKLEALGFAGKINLVGISMGCLAHLRYMMSDADKVNAAVLTIPAVNVEQHHATDTPAGATAQIVAAHGGAPQAAKNPAAQAASIATPKRLYVASNDTSCLPSWANDFADDAPNTEVVDLGAVGHSPVTVNANDVVNFFASHE